MIFKWIGIISACLAMALPLGTLFYSLMYMETGGASGIPLMLSILFAPVVLGIGLVLGAILQGIYSFVVAKSLFKKLEKYTIFRDENGSFLVFFEQNKIPHRLEIKLLESALCFIKYSIMQNQNWCEKSSQEVSIDKPIHNISSLDANIRVNTHWEAIFTFVRFCASLPLDDAKIILLHRSSFITWNWRDGVLLNDSEIPREIQLLQRQDNKTKIKRFFGIMGVIFAPVLCFYLYLQSAFYPCSIYNAVSQGDTKKIERLLKSGVNPNVKCQTKGVIADILEYIFFPSSEKSGQTPLDRAIQDMREVHKADFMSNDIITLLIESGAAIEKEEIDYLPLVFKYASKEVIELFLAKGAFNGSEEQSKSIVSAALDRSAENMQEYEEIAELALSFVQSKELKQEILDRVFLYSDSINKMAILLKHGANINATGEDGESKLMNFLRIIPFTRDTEEIIFLIRNGIDVNIKNKHYNTALDIINMQKQKFEYDKESGEVIEKLLYEKGAKSGAQLLKQRRVK